MSKSKPSVANLFLRQLFRTVTKIYFRDIQVRGAKNLPGPGVPAILAGNHASGLVDSLVLMHAFPSLRISCVAKFSLFEAPIIGNFLKTMEAVPVAQPYDPGLPPEKQATPEVRREMNEMMFSSVADRLNNDINIAIFPEGTCHSLPEMKELKAGCARMALNHASASRDSNATNVPRRVPVIPIGLNFSQPSGFAFRSSVLVDVGKPILVTDELLDLFESGPDGAAEAADRMTKRLDRSLRYVTIAVPDWRDELGLLCERRGWPEPIYEHEASRQLKRVESLFDRSKMNEMEIKMPDRRIRQKVKVTVGPRGSQRVFSSPVVVEEARNTARREKKLAKGLDVTPPVDLGRGAARKAFFALTNASGPLPRLDDSQMVDAMHLARHIYKPDGLHLSLAQYAALTRNFLQGYLRTDALSDHKFGKLWDDLLKYQRDIQAIGITDKIVAKSQIDDKDSFSTLMRARALRDMIRLALETPLSVFGSLAHMPVAAAAVAMGNTMGVEKETGDFSVKATMKCFGAFLACCILYPSIGVAAAYSTGHILSSIPAVVVLGYSGMLAAERRPIVTLVRRARANASLLSNNTHMSDLYSNREDLQTRMRELVDMYADEELRGWWTKDGLKQHERRIKEKQRRYEAEERKKRIVTNEYEMKEALGTMKQYTIQLDGESKRHEHERAVLTVQQHLGNRKALVWLPGRNDSFFHTHLLEELTTECGYDLFALDLRRCGRAKFSASGVQLTEDELAHDSHDFYEYFEELDAVFSYLNDHSSRPATEESKEIKHTAETAVAAAQMHFDNQLASLATSDGVRFCEEYSTSRILQNGGCGKSYDNIVVYAHSTGALIATLYAAERVDAPGGGGGGAWRGCIDGFIFNAPFWNWNLPWYQEMVLRNVQLLPTTWKPTELLSREDKHTPNFDDSLVLEQGGAPNDYSIGMHNVYGFPPELKTLTTSSVTAGWARSVSEVQKLVQTSKLSLNAPTLVLYSDGDSVLDTEDMDKFTESLAGAVGQKIDPAEKPITSRHFIERKIGTSVEEPSSHDVLAAPSSIRVEEAMRYIRRWTSAHFQ